MSLELFVTSVTKLKGKYDRFLRVTFRGVSQDSEVRENCGNEAQFRSTFNWPLSSPLDADESLEIRVFNRNKVFQDRLIGAYRQRLKVVVAQGHFENAEPLLSPNHKLLPTEVKFSVRYLQPTAIDLFADNIVGNDDTKSRKSYKSTYTTFSNRSITGMDGAKDTTDLHDDKELFHPRIMPPSMVNATSTEFQIQVRVIEARDLAGMTLDPVVTITLGEMKKNTTVKPQTNNPIWDEYFCMELIMTETQALDQMLKFDVYTGRNIISQGSIVGSFKLDLWYIYRQPDHCMFSKWAPLVDGANTECRGYLRLDLCVFGKGDIQRDPPPRKDKDEDIELNLIYPENTLLCRPVFKYVFKVFRAEGLPQMNAKLMANVKKALTRKTQDMADPFVEITFAGIKGKTSTKKNTYKPEFLQQIVFTEFFPPLCKTVKIQLKDSDAVSDEPIGTYFIDIEQISNKGDKHLGFMPMFGPSWIHLYGSTRDYTMFDEHIDLNNGIGEGISYRGRILMEMDCFECEPDETGNVDVEDKTIGRTEGNLLFATFYEASMIPKKLGDKPVEFEVTIGEFGVYLEEEPPPQKNGKPGTPQLNAKDIEDEEDALLNKGVVANTMTAPIRPVCQNNEKYFSIPFGSNKPCTYVKFDFEDQRRRTFNKIMLQKIYNTLEENLEELVERIRLELKGTYRLLKRFMGDIVHMCSLFIELYDGKKTGIYLGKNPLDKERMRICVIEVKSLSMTAAKVAEGCMRMNPLNENPALVQEFVQKIQGVLRKLKQVVHEPQQTLPDIFIWMLSGGKRVAYTRIPASDVMFSKLDFERGTNSGRVQTIFLRLPGKRGHGEKGWAIQAKIEVRLWLGLPNKYPGMFMKDVPTGYQDEDDNIAFFVPPKELIYNAKQKFIVRAHIYQARSLIGSDESGLSDAFARVIVTNQALETHVIENTRSPTWDTMLKFEDIEFWGEPEEFAVNPPVIVIEIFDMDKELIGSGSIEFIGRALAKPVVKGAEEPYERPFFPPVLQWFPIYRGDTKAGELLAAFEMFHVNEHTLPEHLPVDPPEENKDDLLKRPVPDEIRPVMTKHRVEVIFWGVREMKRAQLMSINRPRVDIDCCYPTKDKEGNEKTFMESTICKSASKNPNFDNPVVLFDVDLPDNKKYIPPVTIRVHDIRAFGRRVLVGTHIIDTLHKYFRDNKTFVKKGEEVVDPKAKGDDMDDDRAPGAGILIEIPDGEEKPPEEEPKKKRRKEEADKDEEILDWWTRFYETLRDMEEANTKSRKKKKKGNEVTGGKKPEKSDVPRLTVGDAKMQRAVGDVCFGMYGQMAETGDNRRISSIRVLTCDKCQVSVCKFDWSKSQLIT
eukprot:gene7851-13729_t